MYADREEARNGRNFSSQSYRFSTSTDLEIEPRNGSSGHGISQREKELQEQLRKRALASKSSGRQRTDDRGRRPSPSRSPPSRDTSRSRSRSQSKDSYQSRRSHTFRPGSIRDDDRDERRMRRRQKRDAYESRSRRRDRDPEDDDDERAREMRRRRSERDDGYRSSRRGADTYDGSAGSRYDREHPSSYYDNDGDRYERDSYNRRRDVYDRDQRSRSRNLSRYDSPVHSVRSRRTQSPAAALNDAEEYEERSVFCSQLAARLGQRDLGEFLEEHLGEGTVKDVRIVMDKVTRRSKGVGYVEFADKTLVPKAMALSGKVLFGIPILIQRTDAARNRGEYDGSDGPHRPNMHMGIPSSIEANVIGSLPMAPHAAGAPIHLSFGSVAGGQPLRPGPSHPNTAARLYVGSLHFSLTDENVKAVFEPFGEIDYVDLHREPGTGKSKGFAFVQFKEPEDAQKALEQMNGFELAGRSIRVGPVNARVTGAGAPYQSFSVSATGANMSALSQNGNLPTLTSAFDDGGGAGLNPEKRAALMEKLARTESPNQAPPAEQERSASIPQATSASLLLKNMFNPAEETEREWDLDLAEDVKDECQAKYGPVMAIHIEKESAGEIYVTFADIQSSVKAMAGLNGRWFGGKPISAHYIPEVFVKAKMG